MRIPSIVLSLLMIPTWVIAQGEPGLNVRRLQVASARLQGLQYVAAESLSRAVIADPGATRMELKLALAYLGIALWPEDTLDSPRRPATVDSAFRKLVELDPDATLPEGIASWTGPKVRLEEIRRRTLAGRLRYDGPLAAVGPMDSIVLHYRATRAARARLELTGPGHSAPVVIDRVATDTAGDLVIPLNGQDQPIYTTGEYALSLILVDRAQAQTYRKQYVVAIEATPADYLPVNPPGEPPDLLPEVAPPRRLGTLAKGFLLGALTVGVTTSLRGEGGAGAIAGADPRGYAVAGGMTLGAMLAAWRATPRAVPENIRFNLERRDEWTIQRDGQLSENRRRRDSIRTRFRVIEENVE